MAKSKFKTVDMSEEAVQEREMKLEEKRAKKQAEIEVEPEITETQLPQMETVVETVEASETEADVKSKAPKMRSKNYAQARAQIDKNKTYSLTEGIDLLKKIKFTKFDGSLEVHLVLKEITPSVEVQYPHSTGKTLNIAILNDDVLSELEKGKINFDILLATPAQMGKITKFARMLGPKGLMPNPKNGTLISDPEKRKAELSGGKVSVRGEKKAPLMHAIVGKQTMETSQLADNVLALVKALGMGKVIKASICTSMSPSVRVVV